MKIQVVSDLHVEFGIVPDKMDKLYKTDADLTVLAGDFSTFKSVCSDLGIFVKNIKRPVIFVPGNHEYYHGSRFSLDKSLKSLNIPNLHVLIEDTVEIDGVTFVGSTGWWDGSGGNIGLTVKGAINDFQCIYDIKDNLDGIKWGRESKTFFNTALYKLRDKRYTGKVVCVSHHYPHPKSIAKPFRGSLLNACFGNRWEHLIEDYQPDVWIHGHTHHGFNYKVGKTRIVCNPQGYPSNNTTENLQYVPDFTIEV